MGWKRLCGRQCLAFCTALRHRALLDRPNRFSGIAIEHEYKTLLSRLDHDIAGAVVRFDALEPQRGQR